MIYKVNSNLKHSGKRYKEGDEVEMEDVHAKILLGDGIISDPRDNVGVTEGDKPEVTDGQDAPEATAEGDGQDSTSEGASAPEGTSESGQDNAPNGEGDQTGEVIDYSVLKNAELTALAKERKVKTFWPMSEKNREKQIIALKEADDAANKAGE